MKAIGSYNYQEASIMKGMLHVIWISQSFRQHKVKIWKRIRPKIPSRNYSDSGELLLLFSENWDMSGNIYNSVDLCLEPWYTSCSQHLVSRARCTQELRLWPVRHGCGLLCPLWAPLARGYGYNYYGGSRFPRHAAVCGPKIHLCKGSHLVVTKAESELSLHLGNKKDCVIGSEVSAC